MYHLNDDLLFVAGSFLLILTNLRTNLGLKGEKQKRKLNLQLSLIKDLLLSQSLTPSIPYN